MVLQLVNFIELQCRVNRAVVSIDVPGLSGRVEDESNEWARISGTARRSRVNGSVKDVVCGVLELVEYRRAWLKPTVPESLCQNRFHFQILKNIIIYFFLHNIY